MSPQAVKWSHSCCYCVVIESLTNHALLKEEKKAFSTWNHFTLSPWVEVGQRSKLLLTAQEHAVAPQELHQASVQTDWWRLLFSHVFSIFWTLTKDSTCYHITVFWPCNVASWGKCSIFFFHIKHLLFLVIFSEGSVLSDYEQKDTIWMTQAQVTSSTFRSFYHDNPEASWAILAKARCYTEGSNGQSQRSRQHLQSTGPCC